MNRRRRKRAHGAGQLVAPRKAGGPWGIRWREGERRFFRGGFATREIAERVLAKMMGNAALGKAGLPLNPASAPPLGELAEPFFERRKQTHRAADCDLYRWKNHLKPHFAHLRPADVDAARIRSFVTLKLAEGLSAGTVRIFVALLSGLFEELVERGIAQVNPVRTLPRSTRRLVKPTYDPRTTPFIERLDDVRRVFLALPEPLNVAFAIGAFAGLRTGEVFALQWKHVDLTARRIHVRESVKGPLKDKESRIAPILDPLLPVLTRWKLQTGGEGVVIPPMRCDGNRVSSDAAGKYLRKALEAVGIARPGLGWYEATRHTFASQWVLHGGSIEKLKEILGHYSVVVTERYTHLRPDLFMAKDFSVLAADLTPADADPVRIGQTLGSAPEKAPRKAANSEQKRRSGSVSRVLSRGVSPAAVNIHLGAWLPRHLISEQPGGDGRAILSLSGASLLALAPGGVCRAASVA